MSRSTLTPPDPDAGATKSVAADGETPRAARQEGLCVLVTSAAGVSIVRLAPGSVTVLGRAADAGIVVDDPSVSRHHARISVGDRVSLIDLGSSNGTRVDDRRLPKGEEVGLRVGSSFELGSASVVLLRAQGLLEDGAASRTVEKSHAPAAPEAADDPSRPIVEDEAMRRLYTTLDLIAPSPLSVLVLGETGVGKEVFAESIHRKSRRADRPFLQLNCAAIPESLLESELFGYERGAFTGATQAKEGLFEVADTGTVFLDEIGEVPLGTQAKLLRVLEVGEVMRLGSTKSKRVDVRIVSATNRDLRAFIGEGRFRADLYFRLNGITVTLPPLRRRRDDVVPLAKLFLRRVSARLKRRAPELAPRAAHALERQSWPGNVRELRNVVERAVVMCPGNIIELEHLMLPDEGAAIDDEPLPSPVPSAIPPAGSPGDMPTGRFPIPTTVRPSSPRDSLTAQLAAIEKESILDALTKTAGNQSKAARMLGITRRVLINRLEQYGIARPRKEQK